MEGWRVVRVFLSPRKTSMAYKIKKRQSKIKIVLHKDICRLGTITNVQTKLNCVRCIDLCQLLLITLLSWNIFFLYQQRILMTNSDPGESSYFAIVSSPTMFFCCKVTLFSSSEAFGGLGENWVDSHCQRSNLPLHTSNLNIKSNQSIYSIWRS